jgi:hypothetical protein
MEGMAPAVENLGAQPRKLGAAALDEKKKLFRVCYYKSSQCVRCHRKSLVDFSATTLNFFFALHATAVRLDSNDIKLQV